MKRKYTDEQLIEAVKISFTVSETLSRLGLNKAGGSSEMCKKHIARLKLDISHFKGKGWKRGIKRGYSTPLQDYLSNKIRIHSDKLKRRLFAENIFEKKCYKCNRRTWFKETIPLELHHIDHNSDNNHLANLIIICPNCHTYLHHCDRKNKSA